MSEKTARGTITLRNTGEGWVVEHGFDAEGPMMATHVSGAVEKLLKRNPKAVVMGPTHSLGPQQTADPYSDAPYAVLDRRGKVVAEGYEPTSLLHQNIGRLLGWKRGSEETVENKKATSLAGRTRRTWQLREAARAPSGLYGYTKKTQSDCESAIRKINRKATSMMRAAYRKDERVLDFLQTHSRRASSNPARVLLSAWKSMSKVSNVEGGKVAAGRSYSLYGYPSKTVKLGLALCSQLREETGSIAATLHARRVARHAKITGFFKQHSKAARCYSSRMLLAGYPDSDARYAAELNKTAKTACEDGECTCGGSCGCGDVGAGMETGAPQPATPTTVDDWLEWDLDEVEAS